jgi:very-short-patch-repair endonuclease
MKEYITISCANCNKVVEIPKSVTNRGKGRFCSWYCYIHFRGETSIEKMVRVQLSKAKIPFQQEVKISKYHADFLIEKYKLAIECDGDYWHGLTQAIKKDKIRDGVFLKAGYRVARFSETEIKQTRGLCVVWCILSLEGKSASKEP